MTASKDFATDLPRKISRAEFDARAAAIWGELTAQATALPCAILSSQRLFVSRGHRIVTRALRHSSAWAAR